jgi:hypothetical protein
MNDYIIFRSAHEKNYNPLIELLRSGAELTPRHRDLLAKILEGKITRPAHRKAKTLRDLQRTMDIAKRVRTLEADECKQIAAIAQAADEFCCSVSTVKTALRNDRAAQDARVFIKTLFSTAKSLRLEGNLKSAGGLLFDLQDAFSAVYAEAGLKRWRKPRVWDADEELILF